MQVGLVTLNKTSAYVQGISGGFDVADMRPQGFTTEINTNLIERFHGTLKDRINILRGFKSVRTAKLILDGFVVNYNFFRPHMTLNNTTPAQEAGINLTFNTWEGLLRYLSKAGIR